MTITNDQLPTAELSEAAEAAALDAKFEDVLDRARKSEQLLPSRLKHQSVLAMSLRS